jgi:hypothetical protein
MIHEVDDALRRVLRAEALRGTDVEIALDAPTRDWAARRNAPTVNMYLYDIREDMRRRQRGMINEYDGPQNKIVARHLPPRYIKMSYLVTAWTQRPEDEHRLLSSLLLTLLRYDAVPPAALTGSLAEFGLPVPLTVALPPPEDRAFADVWTALGGELKPSLDVVISAPVTAGRASTVDAYVDEGLRLQVRGDDEVGHRRHPDDGAPADSPEEVARPRVVMVRHRPPRSDPSPRER